MDNFTQSKGKKFRTYSVGLRVPESLLTELNSIVKEREILQFLLNYNSKKNRTKNYERNFESFKRYKNISNSKKYALINGYRELYNKYSILSNQNLRRELHNNKNEIDSIAPKMPKNRSERTDWNKFKMPYNQSEIPNIRDLANPSPDEISLRDYQYMANHSLKMMCTHFNTVAEENVTKLDINKEYTETEFIKLFSGGDLDKVGCIHLLTMWKVYQDMASKLSDVEKLFFDSNDFESVRNTLMAFYSVPKYFRVYLSKKWKGLDLNWIRNTIVGWRRAMNNGLPKKLQIESLTTLLLNLAEYCKRTIKLTDLEIETLHNLQHKNVLHLLFKSIDLSPLYNVSKNASVKRMQKAENLKLAYKTLKKKVKRWTKDLQTQIDAHTTSFESGFLIDLADKLKNEVRNIMDKEGISKQGKSNCQTFINKLNLLIEILGNNGGKYEEIKQIFKNYVPGNRFTRSVQNLIKDLELAKNSGLSRLYTALRGIAASAFAFEHSEASAQFKGLFTPEKCLTKPFTSLKRKYKDILTKKVRRNMLPFNSKSGQQGIYITSGALGTFDNTRMNIGIKGKLSKNWENHKNNSKFFFEEKNRLDNPIFIPLKLDGRAVKPISATYIMKQGKPIWIGIPIFVSKQFKGRKLISLEKKGRRGAKDSIFPSTYFWFRLFPSKKIVDCLNNGAEVRFARLSVPKGPTNKVKVDLVLVADDVSSFRHNGNFLKSWDEKFNHSAGDALNSLKSSGMKSQIVSCDFNRIGKYMLAVATPREELNITPLMKSFERSHARLEKYRKKTIPILQKKCQELRNLQRKSSETNEIILIRQKRLRVETEITLIHQKRARLTKEMKQRVLMMYLYVGKKLNAKYLGWDGIQGIETRGKAGNTPLTMAITYLPKRKELFDIFKSWTEDLQSQGLLSNDLEIKLVSPFTSSICSECGQKTSQKNNENYDDFICDNVNCKSCGVKRNRHSNGARVGAKELQDIVGQKKQNNFTLLNRKNYNTESTLGCVYRPL